MKIAVLSDAHDHTTHLLTALAEAERMQCTHLLYLGDIVMLSTYRLMLEEWKAPMDVVFGNNEYDLQDFRRITAPLPHRTHHGYHGDLTLGGRRIFITHTPRDAAEAANCGRYDAVFFGHTHRAEHFTVGRTLVANPGEIYGRQEAPGFAVYDTETGILTYHRI